MNLLRRLSPLVLGLLVAGVPLAAEPHVWTNADLERIEPLPTQTAPLARFDETEWSRVERWLAAEHARLDAELERRHELELARERTDRFEYRRRHSAFLPWFGARWYAPAPPRRAERPRPTVRPARPERPDPPVTSTPPRPRPAPSTGRAPRLVLPRP